MDTTPLGYPYPEGGDAITDYPAVAQALAEMLDDENTITGGTIAAINAQVGGGRNGKRAVLHTAGGSMPLVWDATTGKWASPMSWWPMLTGADSFAGSGVASGGLVELGSTTLSRFPVMPYKVWKDAGMFPALKLVGIFGIDFSGSNTTRLVRPTIYGSNLGDAGLFGMLLAYGTDIPITVAPASPEIFESAEPPSGGGGASSDFFVCDFFVFGTGVGTFSYAAKSVSCGFRWLSV